MVKVTILSARAGRKSLTPETLAARGGLADAVREVLMDQIVETTEVSYSHGKMKNLVNSIRLRATNEALAIFPRAIDIIKRSRTLNLRTREDFELGGTKEAFTDRDLSSSRGRTVGRYLTLGTKWGSIRGTVDWQHLSPSWVMHKYGTNKQNYNKFFMNTGQLVNQLRDKVRWVAELGGVGADAKIPPKGGRISRESLKFVIADVKINIFPGLRPDLMPMLASQRWTSSNAGQFEKSFFGGKMGEKLAGPPGFHRPLMLPLIQFWTAFRIPRAIEMAVHDWTYNPNRGGGV